MSPLRVGFGSAPITPPVPVWLAGFSARTQPATSVHDELEARVVYLRDARGALCLVVCDLLGMSPDFALEVRAAVGAVLEIDLTRVLTACTHTHSGPNAIRGADALGWLTPEGYEQTVVAGCVSAARAAQRAAEPAALHFIRAPLPDGLSVNRRGLPYRPTFAALDVRRADDSRVGTIANVGIHPVALGPECLAVSTDWVGPFRTTLERAGGGAVVLLQGALGDVNPALPGGHGHDLVGSFADADRIGTGVAAAVTEALVEATPVGDELSVIAARELRVSIAKTALAELTGATGELPVELVEWSLGGARLVSVPGEAFHAFGRAVEDSRDGPVLLAGLAPGWQGYLPLPFGDGYEESVSFGAPAVQAILAALTHPPPAPSS